MPAALRPNGPDGLCEVLDNHADNIDLSLVDVSFPQNGVLRLVTNDGTTINKLNQPKFTNAVTIGLQITKDDAPNANRINWNAGEYQINAQTRTVTFGTLNLSSGDPVNPRIDTIIGNLALPFPNGQITVLTGVADPNPVPLPIDPLTQLVLAYVLVDPGATAATGGYTLVPFNTSQSIPLPPGTSTGQALIWNNTTQSWNAGTISGTLPNGNTLFQTIRWDGTNWVPYNRVTMGTGLEDFLINGMTFRFIGLVSASPGAGRFDVQSFGTIFNTTGNTTLNSTGNFTQSCSNYQSTATFGTEFNNSGSSFRIISPTDQIRLTTNLALISSDFILKTAPTTNGVGVTGLNIFGTDINNQLRIGNNTRTLMANIVSQGSTSNVDQNSNLAVINHSGNNFQLTTNSSSVLINTSGSYINLNKATIIGGSRGELHTVVVNAGNNFTFSDDTRRVIILPNNDSQSITLPAPAFTYEGRICQITIGTPFEVQLNGNGNLIEGFANIKIGNVIQNNLDNPQTILSDIEVQFTAGQWRIIDRNIQSNRRKFNTHHVWAPTQPSLPSVFNNAITTFLADSTSTVTIDHFALDNRFPTSSILIYKAINTGDLIINNNLTTTINGSTADITVSTGDALYLEKLSTGAWITVSPAAGISLSPGTIAGQTLVWNGSAWISSDSLVNGMEISALPSLSTDFSGILVNTSASSEFRGFLKTYSGDTDIFGGVLVNDTPSAFSVGMNVENQSTSEQHSVIVTENNITTLSQDGTGFRTDLVITPGEVFTQVEDDLLLSYSTQVLPTGFYTGGRINRASYEKTFGIYTLRNETTTITTSSTFVVLNTNATIPVAGRGVAQISPGQFVITNLADHTIEITLSGQASISGGADEFEFQLWLNGNPTTQSYIAEITNTPRCISYSYFLDVTAGDLVEMYVANNTNTSDITFFDGSFTIKEL